MLEELESIWEIELKIKEVKNLVPVETRASGCQPSWLAAASDVRVAIKRA